MRSSSVCPWKFLVWLAVSWISTSTAASIISSQHAGESIEVSPREVSF
jgi:hypothetical protein